MADRTAAEGELLASSEAWARFSAIMLELTGMPAALFSPSGEPLAMHFTPEDMNPICRLIQDKPAGLEACLACNRSQFARVAETRRPSRYRCHVGITDFALPVMHQGSLVAIISSGQLLPSPATGGGFEPLHAACRRFGIEERALREAYFRAPYLSEPKVEAALELLTFFAEHLYETSRRIRDLTEDQVSEPVRRVLQMIAEEPSEDLTLAKAAEAVGYSPGHLSRQFQRFVGVSFSEALRDARLGLAKAELAGSRRRIAEIALACGFGSLSQFNRTFRKAVGCTPREFRGRAAAQSVSE